MIRGSVALILAVCGPFVGAAVAAPCSDSTAELRWDGGSVRFAVEIADSPDERARGLMYRESLPATSGMLFVYDSPQTVSVWMKNTLIPLDILFIAADGTVKRIASKAKPHDEAPLPAGTAVQFVLEINGGLAARLGLGEGAVLRHPAIDPRTAKWTCAAP